MLGAVSGPPRSASPDGPGDLLGDLGRVSASLGVDGDLLGRQAARGPVLDRVNAAAPTDSMVAIQSGGSIRTGRSPSGSRNTGCAGCARPPDRSRVAVTVSWSDGGWRWPLQWLSIRSIQAVICTPPASGEGERSTGIRYHLRLADDFCRARHHESSGSVVMAPSSSLPPALRLAVKSWRTKRNAATAAAGRAIEHQPGDRLFHKRRPCGHSSFWSTGRSNATTQ